MKVQHFPANTTGRDFVVGDLHGCLGLLQQLLRDAGFDASSDRVFSVGDLADRGPDSAGCLALLREPWFHAVRGNHEEMLIETAKGNDTALGVWMANGGRWILDFDDKPEAVAELSDLAEALPLAIVVGAGTPGRFNLVHAEYLGTDDVLDAGEFSPHVEAQMVWGRQLIGGHVDGLGLEIGLGGIKQPGLSPTYVGHTIRPAVQRVGSHIYLDTGAYQPFGRLTMIEPATGREWQAGRGGDWLDDCD